MSFKVTITSENFSLELIISADQAKDLIDQLTVPVFEAASAIENDEGDIDVAELPETAFKPEAEAKKKECESCGADISGRAPKTKRCEECSVQAAKEKHTERSRENYVPTGNPVGRPRRSEADKKRQSDLMKKKWKQRKAEGKRTPVSHRTAADKAATKKKYLEDNEKMRKWNEEDEE